MTLLPHVKHMLNVCEDQKTMTTSRLEKELKRIDNQASVMLEKTRQKYQNRIATLNARAQRAESLLHHERSKKKGK